MTLSKYRDRQTAVRFRCSCGFEFESEPDRTENAPDRGHPFAYFAFCEQCSAEASQVPWEIGMMSRWARATGPKSLEGKAKTSANLEGHSTDRTRFNAMKHGLAARTAKFFPAKPGKYPHCETCNIPHDHCAVQPACLKRTELFMRHHLASEYQDPDLLREIQSDVQAGVSAVLEDMLVAIVSKGVLQETPEFGFDKDGETNVASYIDPVTGEKKLIKKLSANPLLKVLAEFLTKNNMSLADLNLTQKIKADTEIQMGHLSREDVDREDTKLHRQRQTELMEVLKQQIGRSQQRVSTDPVLAEYNSEDEG